MARTIPLSRAYQHQDNLEPPDDEEQLEMNGHLTEEDKRRREELEEAPMRAELKHLEKRWTKKGRGYITEPRDDDDLPDPKYNWYDKFALCVTRLYDESNKRIETTSLQVNSPALKRLLKNVIGSYPGVSFNTGTISLDFPPRCLYHYLPELKAEKARLDAEDPDSEEAQHLPILLEFINEHFHDVITEVNNLCEQGLISYEHLWTIFKPESLVYTTKHSQPRVFRMKTFSYLEVHGPGLQLCVEFVDFDGDKFGTRDLWVKVPQFSGASSICALNVLPLRFCPAETAVRKRLVERGRRWEAHSGQKFRQYNGIALDVHGNRFNIDSRIMIDVRTFHRLQANHVFEVCPLAKNTNEKGEGSDVNDAEMELIPTGNNEGFAQLTDEQRLMATPMVCVFSMAEKKFLDFFIDNVSDIDWDTRCFEQLVLPQSQKDLVQALVGEHTKHSTDPNAADFEDIVKGKSRGLILLLHGPPGVGKTLTAECVAEFSKRPLYIVSSGDLDTDPSVLDERLGRTLDLASTWKAVLLIEEADVFLERRSLHDLQRNGLVSIFLRTLEYYSGILFMTTNRVQTFDDAFKSRIHVPLKYGNLPQESRGRIWRNFLRGAGEGVAEGIDEAGYEALAEAPLNGRQIKNVVRTAKSLASYKKRRLDLDQLKQVMEIQMAFERDMDAAKEDVDMVAR
ncbi:ATPase family AAA domain-containing protein 3B [Tolypocladium ophioglossoides CBS 100239]|uniref:ATPase family AAA domain-containing protein 3B n=1 Tax=Tolypocladium ophioglossoides (strain CBS 100239) TaxID=1163406 RepID=A0A0L0NKF3_TOLOC|nr:ATPase family AAA domain-containing protein 3B [Tolypocladium ophioglossoides CBS 100239]